MSEALEIASPSAAIALPQALGPSNADVTHQPNPFLQRLVHANLDLRAAALVSETQSITLNPKAPNLKPQAVARRGHSQENQGRVVVEGRARLRFCEDRTREQRAL